MAERTLGELADALEMFASGDVQFLMPSERKVVLEKIRVLILESARRLREMEGNYDPWKNGLRCEDDAPSGHGGVCQLPRGHTCDHVWFGDAGKFSSNPFAGEDVNGKSDRWPLLILHSREGSEDDN